MNKLSGYKKDFFTMSLAEMEVELINLICEKIVQPELDRIESFFNFVFKRYSKKVSSFNNAIDLPSLIQIGKDISEDQKKCKQQLFSLPHSA